MACRRTFANRGEVKNIYRHSNAPDRDEAQSRGNPGVTPHVLAASPDHDDDGGDYGGQGVTTVVSVSDQLVQRQKGGRKPRKSCSFCAKRKKKCSGNGIDKCRYYRYDLHGLSVSAARCSSPNLRTSSIIVAVTTK